MVAAIVRSVQDDKIRGAADTDGWMDATSGRDRCIAEPVGLAGAEGAPRTCAGSDWACASTRGTGEEAGGRAGTGSRPMRPSGMAAAEGPGTSTAMTLAAVADASAQATAGETWTTTTRRPGRNQAAWLSRTMGRGHMALSIRPTPCGGDTRTTRTRMDQDRTTGDTMAADTGTTRSMGPPRPTSTAWAAAAGP